MDLIDRYIYAVVKWLPEKQREDIEKELRSLIEDMLRERCENNPQQQSDIEGVLNELGDPAKLAAKYRDDKNYLIGPEYFDLYLFILKIVLIAVAFGTGLGTTIGFLENPPVLFISGFAQVLASMVAGAFQGFAWVTIIFAVVERYADHCSFRIKKAWSLSDLPEIPKKEELMKPADAIVGIVFSLLFFFIFCFAVQLFGVYNFQGGKLVSIIPVFSQQGIKNLLPLFVVLCFLSILKECLKLIIGKWNLNMGIIALVLNFITFLLCGLIFTNSSVWNADFISEMNASGIIPTGVDMGRIWSGVTGGFFYLIAFALLIDSVVAVVRGFKHTRKPFGR